MWVADVRDATFANVVSRRAGDDQGRCRCQLVRRVGRTLNEQWCCTVSW